MDAITPLPAGERHVRCVKSIKVDALDGGGLDWQYVAGEVYGVSFTEAHKLLSGWPGNFEDADN